MVAIVAEGGVWKAGVSDYTHGSNDVLQSAANAPAGSTGAANILLSGAGSCSSTASNGGVCGEVRLFNPASTTAHKLFTWMLSFSRTSTPNFNTVYGGGRYKGTTNAIDGVRFEPTSGTWASGTVALYGLRK
jgi:hypothetical protein